MSKFNYKKNQSDKPKKEAKESKEKFAKVMDETQEYFDAVMKKINQPFAIKFVLIQADRQKVAVKVQKISDVYQFITNADVIVSFNETIFNALDETAKEILLLQEIDKVHVNIDSGKIKFTKPDMVTFSGIIKKFGLEKVARANQLNELVAEGENLAKETETFFR